MVTIIFRGPGTLTSIPFRCYPNYARNVVRHLMTRIVSRLNVRNHAVNVTPINYTIVTCSCFAYSVVRTTRNHTPTITANIGHSSPRGGVIFACRNSNSLTSVNVTRAIRTTTHGRGVAIVFIGGTVRNVANNRVTPADLPNRIARPSPCNHSIGRYNCPIQIYRVLSRLRNPRCLRHIAIGDMPGVHGTGGTVGGTFRGRVSNGNFSLVRIISSYPAG